MQQGARRPARHAAISVGRAGSDVLLQNQHRPHAGDIVERGDEVHFRRAGIGETDINAIGDERTQQTFSTVHGCPSVRRRTQSDANAQWRSLIVMCSGVLR